MSSTLDTLESVNSEINATWTLLDTEYNLDRTSLKNVVLFVGITGSGKSTLCQFLAGNPNLRAIKGGSIVDNDNKVSNSTTQSKTFLPEVVLVPNTDTVLIDCPGFSDTRNAKYDISNAVFTKKLLDSADQVKMMVVIDHPAMRRGITRTGFTHMLGHLVKFIKDIKKYEDSIGLLVTKVDNIYEEDENGVPIYVTDEAVINEIGQFLRDTKVELASDPKKVQLIDIFIAQIANKYSKIGIFRRPPKPGALNTFQSLANQKIAIHNIINNVLQPRQVMPNDFGLSLSDNSMFIVTTMRETLNTKLSATLDEYIFVYSQKLINSSVSSIDSMKKSISQSMAIVGVLESGINSNLVVGSLLERIEKVDPEHPTQQFQDWMKQQKYLEFLDSVSSFTSKKTNDYRKYQRRLNDFKERIAVNIKSAGFAVENTIVKEIGKVFAQVFAALENETTNLALSPERTYAKLSEDILSMYNSYDQFRINQGSPNLSYENFLSNFRSANFTIPGECAQKLESFRTDIVFFNTKLNRKLAVGQQDKWLQGFSLNLSNIKKTADWYSFVDDSHTKMSNYDNQDLITKNYYNLKNWSGFKALRKQLDANAVWNSILALPELTTKMQIDVNNLIDSVLPTLDVTCGSSKLVVKGVLVKISQVKSDVFHKCPSFKELYIFAKQTVFIDASLVEPGKNVYIIAPVWEILGKQSINLRGLVSRNPKQCSEAGDPGQPGGNFIGVGDKFINDISLTVDASGGDGGNGTDGCKSQNGEDGKSLDNSRVEALCRNNCLSFEYSTRKKRDLFGLVTEVVKLIRGSGSGSDSKQSTPEPVKHTCTWEGTAGTPGTNGGDGGKAGLGAKNGQITITQPSKIERIFNSGKNGTAGMGATGGIGGRPGKTSHIVCSLVSGEYLFTNRLVDQPGQADNGIDGVSGIAGDALLPAVPSSFEPLTTVAGQYKEYVQQKATHFMDPVKFINQHVPKPRKQRSAFAYHAAPVVETINHVPKRLTIDHKFESLQNKSVNSTFSLASFLTLADVLIRKQMKVKPIHNRPQVDPAWKNLLNQAEVLKMVEKCELEWHEQNRHTSEETTFDPVCLQRELKQRLTSLNDES